MSVSRKELETQLGVLIARLGELEKAAKNPPAHADETFKKNLDTVATHCADLVKSIKAIQTSLNATPSGLPDARAIKILQAANKFINDNILNLPLDELHLYFDKRTKELGQLLEYIDPSKPLAIKPFDMENEQYKKLCLDIKENLLSDEFDTLQDPAYSDDLKKEAWERICQLLKEYNRLQPLAEAAAQVKENFLFIQDALDELNDLKLASPPTRLIAELTSLQDKLKEIAKDLSEEKIKELPGILKELDKYGTLETIKKWGQFESDVMEQAKILQDAMKDAPKPDHHKIQEKISQLKGLSAFFKDKEPTKHEELEQAIGALIKDEDSAARTRNNLEVAEDILAKSALGEIVSTMEMFHLLTAAGGKKLKIGDAVDGISAEAIARADALKQQIDAAEELIAKTNEEKEEFLHKPLIEQSKQEIRVKISALRNALPAISIIKDKTLSDNLYAATEKTIKALEAHLATIKIDSDIDKADADFSAAEKLLDNAKKALKEPLKTRLGFIRDALGSLTDYLKKLQDETKDPTLQITPLQDTLKHINTLLELLDKAPLDNNLNTLLTQIEKELAVKEKILLNEGGKKLIEACQALDSCTRQLNKIQPELDKLKADPNAGVDPLKTKIADLEEAKQLLLDSQIRINTTINQLVIEKDATKLNPGKLVTELDAIKKQIEEAEAKIKATLGAPLVPPAPPAPSPAPAAAAVPTASQIDTIINKIFNGLTEAAETINDIQEVDLKAVDDKKQLEIKRQAFMAQLAPIQAIDLAITANCTPALLTDCQTLLKESQALLDAADQANKDANDRHQLLKMMEDDLANLLSDATTTIGTLKDKTVLQPEYDLIEDELGKINVSPDPTKDHTKVKDDLDALLKRANDLCQKAQDAKDAEDYAALPPGAKFIKAKDNLDKALKAADAEMVKVQAAIAAIPGYDEKARQAKKKLEGDRKTHQEKIDKLKELQKITPGADDTAKLAQIKQFEDGIAEANQLAKDADKIVKDANKEDADAKKQKADDASTKLETHLKGSNATFKEIHERMASFQASIELWQKIITTSALSNQARKNLTDGERKKIEENARLMRQYLEFYKEHDKASLVKAKKNPYTDVQIDEMLRKLDKIEDDLKLLDKAQEYVPMGIGTMDAQYHASEADATTAIDKFLNPPAATVPGGGLGSRSDRIKIDMTPGKTFLHREHVTSPAPGITIKCASLQAKDATTGMFCTRFRYKDANELAQLDQVEDIGSLFGPKIPGLSILTEALDRLKLHRSSPLYQPGESIFIFPGMSSKQEKAMVLACRSQGIPIDPDCLKALNPDSVKTTTEELKLFAESVSKSGYYTYDDTKEIEKAAQKATTKVEEKIKEEEPASGSIPRPRR